MLDLTGHLETSTFQDFKGRAVSGFEGKESRPARAVKAAGAALPPPLPLPLLQDFVIRVRPTLGLRVEGLEFRPSASPSPFSMPPMRNPSLPRPGIWGGRFWVEVTV